MVESVGKKLHQARLQRGLTIDEAAHATKLRPDKIAALESDDYSRFANNIYAKGFLQIYGRYLKVDVEEFARTLDNANPISISDYQYLSNAPALKSDPVQVRDDDRRRPPSLAPLFVFVLLIGCGVAGMWVYQNYERIQGDPGAKHAEDGKSGEVTAKPTPNPDSAFISEASPAAPTPVPKAITPLRVATPPANAPRVAPATPAGKPAAPVATVATPAPLATGIPHAATPAPLAPGVLPPAKPEQDFVTPAPIATGDNATRPAGTNEVLVAAVKKTWVTVRRDDPKATPIFEDYVYPNANPLKLKGARFFIEAKDPSAVQITKNGLPYAYQPNGAPVQ